MENMAQNGFPHHHNGHNGSSMTLYTSRLQMKSLEMVQKITTLVTTPVGILSFIDISKFNSLSEAFVCYSLCAPIHT